MALVQIQPSIKKRDEESTLEKIALAFNIAQGALGTALAVPKFLQERKAISKELELKGEQIGTQKSLAAKERAEAQATIGSKYRPLAPGESEAQSVDFGPEYGGKMTLRAKTGDLSEFDKKVFDAYSQDYVPVNTPGPKSVPVTLGGETIYFNPKISMPGGKDVDTREKQLRSDFLDQSKQFFTQSSAYGRILASAKEPSAAGDLALIFGYMKVLDPGSTVREGEFANAQNSGGIPDRIRAQYNKVISGERLSDAMRNDFVDRAGRLYKSELDMQKVREDKFTNLAHEKDLNPSAIVMKLYNEDLGKIIKSAGKSKKTLDTLSDEELKTQLGIK